jgi:Papain-like cysteine protease AvrRpt2
MSQRSLVPFFSNTEDNYHCFQAALRMLLSHYQPHRVYSWNELDGITAHTANYTWPAAGLLYCVSIGLDVLVVEDFDYERFGTEGYSYLVEVAGKEVADDQRKNSNLEQEMEYAKRLRQSVRTEQRVPLRKDLADVLEQGAVVICNVNSCALVEQKGYAGHFVVVIGIGKQGVRLHDPGLPPRKDMIVSWGRFERAWSYPNRSARNIIAVTSKKSITSKHT